MFGSNFMENFGIPSWQDFPFQGTDPQGGLFGFNQPPPEGGDMMKGIPGGPASPQQAPGGPYQQGLDQRAPYQASPLAPGGGTPLAQQSLGAGGQEEPRQPSPAAGIGTDFNQQLPKPAGTV